MLAKLHKEYYSNENTIRTTFLILSRAILCLLISVLLSTKFAALSYHVQEANVQSYPTSRLSFRARVAGATLTQIKVS